MLNPEVYKRTYGIKCCYIMNDLPPLFIFKPLLGNAIVLTSPYITNTYFGNHPADRWNEYVQKCVEFCKKNNGILRTLSTDAKKNFGVLITIA